MKIRWGEHFFWVTVDRDFTVRRSYHDIVVNEEIRVVVILMLSRDQDLSTVG